MLISGRGTKGHLEGCDITSRGANAVANAVQITEGAHAFLVANTIHDTKGSGIVIMGDGSEGRLERNDVWGHQKYGVALVEGADAIVLANKIHDCQEAGVLVGSIGTKGLFERNRVFGSSHGFLVSDGAAPTILHNRIHGNLNANVVFQLRGTRGRLACNAIFGGDIGVFINDAEPLVESNAIHSHEKVWGPLMQSKFYPMIS